MPRAGIKLTLQVFWASGLQLHHIGSLMSPPYICLPVHAAPCFRGKCRLLHSSPCNCKSFNAYNFIHTGSGMTHTQSTFNNHPAHSLYGIIVMATSVMGVTKMGNIVPRAVIEPTSLVFWASVLPLQHIGSLISPLYPCLSAYADPCLRGQCRLQYY